MNDSHGKREKMVKRSALVRKLGCVVLLLAIAVAVVLYEVRTRSGNVMDDPMLANFSKADAHQMEVLYGKMGTMITDFMDDLKRPGVQAFLIALAGLAIAGGCFFVASRMEDAEAEE